MQRKPDLGTSQQIKGKEKILKALRLNNLKKKKE